MVRESQPPLSVIQGIFWRMMTMRYNADLSLCLRNLSVYCSDLNQNEEALVAAKEAVDLYRILATYA